MAHECKNMWAIKSHKVGMEADCYCKTLALDLELK